MQDNNKESLSEAQQREENARIFKALSKLRRANAQSEVVELVPESVPESAPEKRTWGSLQFAYPDQNTARVHAALKPFMYVCAENAHDEVARALRKFGIVPVEDSGALLEDVFKVQGAVEGLQKIQIFIENGTLTEYLFLEK